MAIKATVMIAVIASVLSCAAYALWIDTHVHAFFLSRQLQTIKRTPPEAVARMASPDGRYEAVTLSDIGSDGLSPRPLSLQILPAGQTNEIFRFSFWSFLPPGSNFLWSSATTLSSTRMPPGIVYMYGGRDVNTQNLDRLNISINVK